MFLSSDLPIPPCSDCPDKTPDTCECGLCGSVEPCKVNCFPTEKDAKEKGLIQCQPGNQDTLTKIPFIT